MDRPKIHSKDSSISVFIHISIRVMCHVTVIYDLGMLLTYALK